MAWTNLDDFITNSPGASWDSDHAQEIKDNVDGIAPTITTGTLSAGGTAVTIADQGNTDYGVFITPLTSSPAGIGEISVVRDSATQFTVYNSGSATCDFVAVVFKN